MRTHAFDPQTLPTRQELLMAAIDACQAFDTRRPGWLEAELILREGTRRAAA